LPTTTLWAAAKRLTGYVLGAAALIGATLWALHYNPVSGYNAGGHRITASGCGNSYKIVRGACVKLRPIAHGHYRRSFIVCNNGYTYFFGACRTPREMTRWRAIHYPVVAHLDGVPVRAPTTKGAVGACPVGVLRLDAARLSAAQRAAMLGLPVIARQMRPRLRLADAHVVYLRHTNRPGDIYPTRRSCWGAAFLRSALIELALPAEAGARTLRGHLILYVARTPAAWVIWEEV